MGLLVLDHLQPVLNGPEKHICGVQVRRHIGAYDPSIAQGNEGVAGARRAQFAVASAMNELMHLSEAFDLPNAAPATLQVIARPECLPLRIMVPDRKSTRPNSSH